MTTHSDSHTVAQAAVDHFPLLDLGAHYAEVGAERLISQGGTALNLVLEPGDIVMVPQAREFGAYAASADARPGSVEYLSSEGITVLQAITAAGGPTERANFGSVLISRRLPDGPPQRIKVNAKKIQRGDAADLLLERKDTVVVGEWFSRKLLRKFPGGESSPPFVRAPEGNASAERFILKLKEQLLSLRFFSIVTELSHALAEFLARYNRRWRVERHD